MRPQADDALSPALEDTAEAPRLPPVDAAAPSAVPDHTLTAPPQMPARSPAEGLAPGLRLGHFQIEKKLGAGGMGEVYLATDLALDRPVAIKVLPAGTTSGTARDRLIREARAQARVSHPNVAHIYFVGEEDGRLYFAMEYVAGRTFADRVAAGPVPVEEALALIRSAALGLREAQRSGFLHRDVKPSNLMLDAHSAVKVLDFGLVAGHGGDAVGGSVDQSSMAGTPLYMAPEQARGEAIDLRADIYALGATMFHLVSGNPPFRADSPAELVTLHATAARPAVPRGANPRTAIAQIDALIARMMAPRAADRFASYDELLHALELASAEHTRPAGFWARGMAGAIDLLVVGTVVTLIGVAFALLATAATAEQTIEPFVFLALALYHVIATRRWGTTIGKSLFELEVVTIATATRPPWGLAVRRSLLLFALPILGGVVQAVLSSLDLRDDIGEVILVVGMVVVGLLLVHASLNMPGKRTPWDRGSRTMVRYRRRQR